MRLHRAHQFLLDALAKAPGVRSVAPWDRGDHTLGVHAHLERGEQMWIGVTVAAAPGDTADAPEIPVTDAPPSGVPYPNLHDAGGKLTPARAQDYLAAAVTNAGNSEVLKAYGYTPAASLPGFGIRFHSGARAFCLIHRVKAA